jgi:predicted metallo-beta-lactamase superfamily hydrolase
MKKVMFITTDPTMPGSMIFNLNERFMNDPEGGAVALEKIIQEARTLIGNHYLAVEKQYAGALQQIGRHRRGVTAINNPAIASNVLKEASAALE